MIPDTFSGGLILSLVNLIVVFLVLVIIAFAINLIYKVVSNAEKASVTAVSEAEIAPVEESGMAEAGDVSEKVAFDSLDGRRKAAIMAALCAHLGHSVVPVFVRKIPDAGAWGKSSRALAIK
ncbi:MAG TPA: OadG family protein [Firmicutes bacterium]|jgi:Na+-transporting methylmalonyl-CoA/oxaloacetate decarboxylase gamma subunit|nr:OadG family protein [Bacillota bacterium]